MDTNKQCGCCKTSKQLEEFRLCTERRLSRYKKGELTYRCSVCKECERTCALERYRKNRDKCIAKNKAYKEKNKDAIKEKRKEYLLKNKEYIKQRYKRYCEENRALIQRIAREYRQNHSLNVRLRKNFKSRIIESIKKNKTTMEYLGSTIQVVQDWLQFNFQDYMTWENYGEVWHIDHTLPVNLFDLTQDIDIYMCFNWKNLMPLRKDINIKKHDNIWPIRVFNQEHRLMQFAKAYGVEESEVNDYLETYCEYFKSMMVNSK
jgi:hypothetical protein